MIVMRDVTCIKGTHTLLSGISLESQSRRLAIIGCNGSGKSTFARLLNGLILPDSGSVEVVGLDTRQDLKRVRQKVGFVFQNPDLQFVFPTVEEDLRFGLKNLRLSESEQLSRVDSVLSRFSLEHLRHRSVHHLSGGEKQLLCVAGVLVMEPELIVFDEPTTLLDLRNRRMMDNVILGLDTSVVVVTHDLAFARECEEAVLVDNGTIRALGKADSVVDSYLELMRQE